MSRFESPKINVNMGAAKGVMIGIIALIVIGVVAAASVQIVDAGQEAFYFIGTQLILMFNHYQKDYTL